MGWSLRAKVVSKTSWPRAEQCFVFSDIEWSALSGTSAQPSQIVKQAAGSFGVYRQDQAYEMLENLGEKAAAVLAEATDHPPCFSWFHNDPVTQERKCTIFMSVSDDDWPELAAELNFAFANSFWVTFHASGNLATEKAKGLTSSPTADDYESGHVLPLYEPSIRIVHINSNEFDR